jgi:hypothetical protein
MLAAPLDVLALWEATAGPPRARDERLLAAAGVAEVRPLPLGEAVREMLCLHHAIGGTELQGTSICPVCGTSNEVSIDPQILNVPATSAALSLRIEGWEVELRQLTLGDLLDAGALGDAVAAEGLLRERAIAAATGPDGPVVAADLPEVVIAAIEERLDELDPLADARLGLCCLACDQRWDVALDIGLFLAQALAHQARAALADVAALARTYGWSERDILAMPPARRRAYLELAG